LPEESKIIEFMNIEEEMKEEKNMK